MSEPASLRRAVERAQRVRRGPPQPLPEVKQAVHGEQADRGQEQADAPHPVHGPTRNVLPMSSPRTNISRDKRKLHMMMSPVLIASPARARGGPFHAGAGKRVRPHATPVG